MLILVLVPGLGVWCGGLFGCRCFAFTSSFFGLCCLRLALLSVFGLHLVCIWSAFGLHLVCILSIALFCLVCAWCYACFGPSAWLVSLSCVCVYERVSFGLVVLE